MKIEIEYVGYCSARMFFRKRDTQTGKILTEEYLGSITPEFLALLVKGEAEVVTSGGPMKLDFIGDTLLNLKTQIAVKTIDEDTLWKSFHENHSGKAT